jgi:hypothetical protein
MEEKQTTRHLARRDERRLLKIATQAVKSDFPNPERLGCPGSGALSAVARRRLSFPDAEDVVDHIATCAPCFSEYTDHRRRYRLRVVGRVALACAACLMAVAIIWRFGPLHLSPRKQPVAHESLIPALKATLDFRNRTVERSDRVQSPNAAETPHLTRALLDIAIKLPIGMEDGVYAVQLRTRLDQPVVNATGTATWDGSVETLSTTVDLRHLAPGEYILAIRKGSSSWRLYPVVLD